MPGKSGLVHVVCSVVHACSNDFFPVERVHDAADANAGLANDLASPYHLLRQFRDLFGVLRMHIMVK